MKILKITKQPYTVFDNWQFMDVLIEDNGTTNECSIIEPLLSTVLNSELPLDLDSESKSYLQLKLF